jgi:nucleoside-diphosphate-sugar epimerase
MTKSILIIGGTGAQGAAVVRYFSSTGLYEIKCTTRDTNPSQAQELASLPHVATVPDGRHGHDELALQRALEDVDYVWVNTNGFALGEQAEMFWGIRMFELSVRAGVKHFVYSGMDSAYKLSGYDPKCRSGAL